MAVFDQRRELNKQQRHIPFQTDDSFGLKLLGYDKYGKNNAWGEALGFIPGVNTGRHLAAQKIAGGDTKQVLKDTLDETVGRDLAGVSFGIDLAKTIATGGLSGFGQGMIGGLGKGAASGVASAAGASDVSGIMSGAMSKMKSGVGGDLNPELTGGITNKIAAGLKNPHVPGSPEYDAFEQKKAEQSGGLKNKFKTMGTDFLKSAATGNIFESGANLISTTITDMKADNEAFKEYARGNMASTPFNYL